MTHPESAPAKNRRRKTFVERTVNDLAEALDHAAYADEVAQRDGLLQQLDPRAKVCGILLLVIAAVSVRNISVAALLFAVALALALLSRISFRVLAKRVWTSVLCFTGVIALPAIFLAPGAVMFRLPLLHWPVTSQGWWAAVRLITRAETASTLALLLVLSTPWTHVLKALRVFHVPVVFVVILGMTHRYIFSLLHLARDFFEARRSRLVGMMDRAQRRHLAASTAGVLLEKSLQLSGDVFLAMRSRGFRGGIYTLDDFRMKPRDWWALGAFVSMAALAFKLGNR